MSSVSEILVTVPPPVPMPRGARWAANNALAIAARGRAMSAAPSLASPYRRQTPSLLQAVGHSIWLALEAAGRRRVAPELRRLAERWESIDPALAQQFREASQYNSSR